jgi:putative N-acetylmannosamine-6-phosphate epimerase
MSKSKPNRKRNQQLTVDARNLSDQHLVQELAKAKAQQRAAGLRVNALEHEQRRRDRSPQVAA